MESFYECAVGNKTYLINKVTYYAKQFMDEDYVLDYNFLDEYITCIVKYLHNGMNLEEILMWTRRHVFYEGNENGFNLIFILKSLKKAIFELISEYKEAINNIEDTYLLVGNVFENMEILIYSEINSINKKICKFNKSSEAIDSPLFLINDGRFKYINSQMVRNIGYKREELYETKCWELVDDDFKEFIKGKVLNCYYMKTDEVYGTRIKVIDKSGKQRWVDLNASKVIIGGKCCIIGIYMDAYEVCVDNNKIEIFNDKSSKNNKYMNNKLTSEFFFNISHELRTPINVILGGIQALNFVIKNNGDLNIYRQRIKTYVSIMNKNALRMTRLSNNLIDIMQIKCGHYKLNLANRDMVKLITNILIYVEKYASMKDIDVEFQSFKNEVIVACDRRKIEKAILNILSNAIKFTPNNGRVHIRIFSSDNNIGISIKDNGIGIPIDKQNNIFEEFVKVDKSLARETEGTGIGLSIAKALVNIQGGEILLKSELGQGSDFKIILPNRKLRSNKNIIDDCIEPFGREKVDVEFSDIYI